MDAEKLNKYFRGDSSQAEKEEVQLWLEKDEKIDGNLYLFAHCMI